MGKAWYEVIQDVDRRIIYLVVFIVVSIPFFVSVKVPIEVNPPAQHLFDCLEKMAAENKTAQKEKIVLIQPEWDPAVQAECEPETRAMIGTLYEKRSQICNNVFRPCRHSNGRTSRKRV